MSITANGGTGGNQLITSDENEGPGGGGGGGHIRSTGTPTVSVTGGNNGTTTSTAVTEFISNGATRGATGASLLSQSFVPVPALDCFPLPVSLISFEAKLNDSKEGVISWVTDIETDLEAYIIEYSTDAVNWNVFSATPARNQPGRQFYTVNTGILRENRFYRLRILNRDQRYTFSATRLLTGNNKTTLVVNGNSLLLQGLSTQAIKIRLFNSNGSLVSDIPFTNNSALVIALNHLAHGVYILKISYAAGQDEVMKFVY